MSHDCDHCTDSFPTEDQLKTHILLNHPSEIEDSSEYDCPLTEGELSTEIRAEKGEQFGYR